MRDSETQKTIRKRDFETYEKASEISRSGQNSARLMFFEIPFITLIIDFRQFQRYEKEGRSRRRFLRLAKVVAGSYSGGDKYMTF